VSAPRFVVSGVATLAATLVLALAPVDRAEARGGFAGAGAGGGGGGGARMAAASVSGANRAAVGNRPGRGDRIDGDGDLNEDGTVDIDGNGRYVGWDYPYYYWYDEDDDDRDREADAAARRAAAAPPPPPPPPPAVGSSHVSVPAGCGTVERGGKFLRNCNGVLYEEKFVGDSLVYTVVQ
jgi:hypothetical protein